MIFVLFYITRVFLNSFLKKMLYIIYNIQYLSDKISKILSSFSPFGYIILKIEGHLLSGSLPRRLYRVKDEDMLFLQVKLSFLYCERQKKIPVRVLKNVLQKLHFNLFL